MKRIILFAFFTLIFGRSLGQAFQSEATFEYSEVLNNIIIDNRGLNFSINVFDKGGRDKIGYWESHSLKWVNDTSFKVRITKRSGRRILKKYGTFSVIDKNEFIYTRSLIGEVSNFKILGDTSIFESSSKNNLRRNRIINIFDKRKLIRTVEINKITQKIYKINNRNKITHKICEINNPIFIDSVLTNYYYVKMDSSNIQLKKSKEIFRNESKVLMNDYEKLTEVKTEEVRKNNIPIKYIITTTELKLDNSVISTNETVFLITYENNRIKRVDKYYKDKDHAGFIEINYH